jgi:hypothetical protein
VLVRPSLILTGVVGASMRVWSRHSVCGTDGEAMDAIVISRL